ncbi:bifunctional 4-carboxymuconolactone decarboxylase/3-oxoadipate enol-lactonase PcaCD [Janthinobacterium agaricidamnosum]|uniref:Carboxymuconolactone decarboxylase family protein n=1 Tax=Janthinobacterium agaricidamnosum NBRC 102515 = DSM 9628 TaxID=1349767 RepID=W0V335_9BURK|nr:alpha/beta fold hydrolase [Janthinobacterium agaricidamnosum]CDG81768.1 carboxymuconolactone decarboxylase family protein [Janthinobacterium agaricidamnosum NBRC 102515 = DSM 9628]
MSFDNVDHDFERGLQMRRAILGDSWVERSLSNANNFNADFQQLITRFAWHDIWGRPGLEQKTRRAMVLATTIALGRWEEFELHVRAALLAPAANRLSPDELKEVLMQSAVYAGVPAANTAFGHAQAILREVGPHIGYALEAMAPAAASHPGYGRAGYTSSKPALHYSVRAPRNGKAPRHTIVLSHALGCDLSMWDGLAHVLAEEHRVIVYDQRGHGGSAAPPGPYTMAELADDAARLLLELDTGPVVWIGLSMGGMVGQELALRHPALLSALVAANTTSGYPEAARDMWRQRVASVCAGGMAAIADGVMQRYFHDAYRAADPATVERFRRRLLATDSDGYIACCGAVADIATTARLQQITVPVLLIAGELDSGTPPAMAGIMAAQLPNTQLRLIAQASHISVIEQPSVFAGLVCEFLQEL